MKVRKRKWVIAAVVVVLLLTAVLWVEWFLQMQRPMSIKLLGEGRIRHVEAGCTSPEGWRREELNQDEMKQLVRVMNDIQGERVVPPPHGPAYGRRMVFSVEHADGKRRHMILSDRTLTIDNDVAYLLSKKDARQIEHLFGEIL